MPALIQEQLGVMAQIVNPFSYMSLADRVDADALNIDAPGYMVACGLALRFIE